MIQQEMTFFYFCFLLLSKIPENTAQMLPQFRKKRFPAIFGKEHDMVLALPFCMA